MLHWSTIQGPVMRSPSSRRSTSIQGIKMRLPWGTPMGEQRHDDDHGLCRGAEPIEDGPFAGAEGFVTLMADEALLLLRMDTDIAHTCLASGMAMLIGAKCRRGVHDAPPGCA